MTLTSGSPKMKIPSTFFNLDEKKKPKKKTLLAVDTVGNYSKKKIKKKKLTWIRAMKSC